MSLNLPVADEALRARASRTTHPLALHHFTALCAAVTERKFVVDNPYLYKTKAEVVATLAKHKAAHLIANTCSCSHSMFQPKTQRHCGQCGQCVDRRFAITTAGLLAYDSERDYVSDVFLGPRKDVLERAIAVDYTRHAIELDRRSETELAVVVNSEISSAVRRETNRSEAAQRIISMNKRHGRAVTRVLEAKIAESAAQLLGRTLDETSLISLVIGQKYMHQQDLTRAWPPGSSDNGGDTAPSPFGLAERGIIQGRADVSNDPCQIRCLRARARGKKKNRKLGKRDTVIFAAIRIGLTGMKYSGFLDNHGLPTKWSNTGPGGYAASYKLGHPWRKKVQDEKSRAKERMSVTSQTLSDTNGTLTARVTPQPHAIQ